MGGEDAAALEVAGDGHLISRRCAGACSGERGPHLGELAHIGVLEHEADVRMGDQRALAIHHESSPCFADLDLRDDVPDELEVDVGHRHTPTATAGKRDDGKRHDHVRLGSLRK